MTAEPDPVFYGAVTVGERGQVVIPQKAREAQEIRPGDKILVLGGGPGPTHPGLLMIKAEALGDLLIKLTHHASALEKALRMAQEANEAALANRHDEGKEEAGTGVQGS